MSQWGWSVCNLHLYSISFCYPRESLNRSILSFVAILVHIYFSPLLSHVRLAVHFGLCTVPVFLFHFLCDFFFFWPSYVKNIGKRIGNFFIWVFVSCVFFEKARNMFISNHHPMTCMSMTSQMMIFSPLSMYDRNRFSVSKLSSSDVFYFPFVYSRFMLFICLCSFYYARNTKHTRFLRDLFVLSHFFSTFLLLFIFCSHCGHLISKMYTSTLSEWLLSW